MPTGRRILRGMAAMLAVSEAVAEGGSLGGILDEIAAAAAGAVDGRGASIVFLRGQHLELVGGAGLSDDYPARLRRAPVRLGWGRGPTGLAVERRQPVVIPDMEQDPRFGPWRELAREEGFRALISVPLAGPESILGAMSVYREEPGPWQPGDVRLLSFFGQHAAHAIRAAQTIETKERQVVALSRLVRGLREQSHEHANRLHTVGGLLALDDVDAARRFVDRIAAMHRETAEAVESRVRQSVLAGLVLAETTIAAQRGITIELAASTSVDELPPRLDEADAVTVVANLLGNAMDAVAAMPRERRRIELGLVQDAETLDIGVRDFGPRVPPEVRERVFHHGFSSKPEHAGVGLSLVARAVEAAYGVLSVDFRDDGTVFRASFPYGGP